jgi:hypothetical protein
LKGIGPSKAEKLLSEYYEKEEVVEEEYKETSNGNKVSSTCVFDPISFPVFNFISVKQFCHIHFRGNETTRPVSRLVKKLIIMTYRKECCNNIVNFVGVKV